LRQNAILTAQDTDPCFEIFDRLLRLHNLWIVRMRMRIQRRGGFEIAAAEGCVGC
jgi:hypothetical protein